ncbi:MAG: hypothetical protein ACLTBV_25270 [Enterocloster bolteae]
MRLVIHSKKEESADGFVNLVHRMCPELDVEVYYEDKRRQVEEDCPKGIGHLCKPSAGGEGTAV